MDLSQVMLRETLEGNLEGSEDVALAPITGQDERRSLPAHMFRRRPLLFVSKTVFAWSLIAVGSASIAYVHLWYVAIPAMILNGLMGTHLVELQHECLHAHAFRSPKLNRLFGVICGLFMMSSHSHYRYDHLRHHAHLGTPKNLEHFNYRFSNLDSLWGFTRAYLDPSRFKRVFSIAWYGVTGRRIPNVDKENYQTAIKHEYILYVSVLICSIIFTIITRSSFFALSWWIPALLVSEGVHFMIEMPEHFGLNTQTDPNVLSNTRTIRTGRLFQWFVNGNDIHTAHHYHHGIPMCNIRALHKMIESKIAVIEPSYRSFYWSVIQGRVRQDMSATCMDR